MSIYTVAFVRIYIVFILFTLSAIRNLIYGVSMMAFKFNATTSLLSALGVALVYLAASSLAEAREITVFTRQLWAGADPGKRGRWNPFR